MKANKCKFKNIWWACTYEGHYNLFEDTVHPTKEHHSNLMHAPLFSHFLNTVSYIDTWYHMLNINQNHIFWNIPQVSQFFWVIPEPTQSFFWHEKESSRKFWTFPQVSRTFHDKLFFISRWIVGLSRKILWPSVNNLFIINSWINRNQVNNISKKYTSYMLHYSCFFSIYASM